MKIVTSAFKDGENIPPKYTCDGQNVNPPLQFLNVPLNTATLVLIMDDPDAPGKTFTHWMAIIPVGTKEIKEATTETFDSLKNDFGKVGYGGPCPPKGNAHRYFFRLYAIGTRPPKFTTQPAKEHIEKWMNSHLIATAELMGRYKRS